MRLNEAKWLRPSWHPLGPSLGLPGTFWDPPWTLPGPSLDPGSWTLDPPWTLDPGS